MEALTTYSVEIWLLAITGLLLFIQILYYLYLYYRIHSRSRAVKRNNIHFSQGLPPLSVIIVSHNNITGLRRSLPAILAQDYPQFEVIVINDGEKSETDNYLKQLEEHHPNLYHSFVPDSSRYISHRKLAITLGIKASKYDWLVQTQTDCLPQSNQWLRTLARNFTSRTQVVLGYSGYEPSNGRFYRRIAFDNLFTSLRYLSMALAGKPYMGIGRNLAYRKELFYNQKGFSAHLHLQHGDDDLFVNQVATGDNTRIETDPLASVRIAPVYRAKTWREEKIGYASTARLYQGKQRYLLGGETLSRLIFHAAWMTTLVMSTLHSHWLVAAIALLAFTLRFILQTIIINLSAKALGDKQRYYVSLLLYDFQQPLQSLRWKLSCLFRKKSDFLRK